MRYAARPEDRYAVFGMKEELDAPGEWYQDVEGQKLYFLPPRSLEGAVVTVPTVNTILNSGVHRTSLSRGLEFTCAEARAVRLHGCERVIIEKSLVHDLGYFSGAGITIRGGHDCTVRGCDLWNLGGHGVSVYAGDKVKMEKCNHVVDNCYIHHVGQFNRHGIGLMIGSCGMILSHNLIHDMPRCGVFYGGVLNTIEYNRIRHCNLEMEDTGCTYGGGWTGGWTTIRYNHCTDSIGFNNHGKFFVFAWGIYLDESGCGYDVYGNIVERCQVGAMHLHNARENHIYNNIFAENGCSDPNPERFGTTHQISLQGWTDDPNGKFSQDREPKMLKRYNELVENPEWKKMRGMAVPPKETILPDGTVMRGNRIERNIFYYPGQPKSRYIRINNCNLEANVFDHNTVWNGGEEPIRTGKKGYKAVAADLTESIPNRQFPAASDELLKNRRQPDGGAGLVLVPQAVSRCEVGSHHQRRRQARAAFCSRASIQRRNTSSTLASGRSLSRSSRARITALRSNCSRKTPPERQPPDWSAKRTAFGAPSARGLSRRKTASGPNARSPSIILPRAKRTMTSGWAS